MNVFSFTLSLSVSCLFQVADIAVRYHSCSDKHHSTSDNSFSSRSPCCQSVVLPESNTSVCEVCLSLSRRDSTSSSTHCSFPSAVPGGDVLRSYLQPCCLHQLPAPASVKTETSPGCSNFLNSYSPFIQYSACCRKVQS